MKNIKFTKMSGNGNDFIVLDNMKGSIKLSGDEIRALCETRFSIGADGLIMAEKGGRGRDFYMKFYNNDGREAEMCGNGGRCIARFAYLKGIAGAEMIFEAKDGLHEAKVLAGGGVKLKMIDPFGMKDNIKVKYAGKTLKGFFVNTGVPHFVTEVKDINKTDVREMGRSIRFDKAFKPAGTNVNFVQRISKSSFYIRTYERGVEDETYACGTGAAASAVAMHLINGAESPVTLKAKGGELKIYFKEDSGKISMLYLEGNARIIAEGIVCDEAFKF
jgi:diaminopimelate epimerase